MLRSLDYLALGCAGVACLVVALFSMALLLVVVELGNVTVNAVCLGAFIGRCAGGCWVYRLSVFRVAPALPKPAHSEAFRPLILSRTVINASDRSASLLPNDS